MQPDMLPRCSHRVRGDGVRLVNVLVDSGVAPGWAYVMECRDVHAMVRVIAGARYVTKADLTLIQEIPRRLPPAPRFDLEAVWMNLVQPFLIALVLLGLGLIGYGAVGFLT